jgi:hypothetical protein
MAIEAEEMKAKKRPIIGGILVFVGLLEIGFGGRAVSIIGTGEWYVFRPKASLKGSFFQLQAGQFEG